MTYFQFRLPVRLWTGLLIATSLSGCSGFGGDLLESRQQISIDSDPQNATVYAEGVEIGVTPLVINPSEVFQARFTTGGSDADGIVAYRYVGTLSVKKPGCKPYTTQVNDNILSKDIDITLECDPYYQGADMQPAATVPASAPPVAPLPVPLETQQPPPTGSAEERLQRIESLHRKGLLSDEEYKALRQRVLDTL